MRIGNNEISIAHQFYPSCYVIMIEEGDTFVVFPVLGLSGIGFFTFFIAYGLLKFLAVVV